MFCTSLHEFLRIVTVIWRDSKKLRRNESVETAVAGRRWTERQTDVTHSGMDLEPRVLRILIPSVEHSRFRSRVTSNRERRRALAGARRRY